MQPSIPVTSCTWLLALLAYVIPVEWGGGPRCHCIKRRHQEGREGEGSVCTLTFLSRFLFFLSFFTHSFCLAFASSCTGWRFRMELQKLNYSICRLGDVFLISLRHLPNSIQNSSYLRSTILHSHPVEWVCFIRNLSKKCVQVQGLSSQTTKTKLGDPDEQIVLWSMLPITLSSRSDFDSFPLIWGVERRDLPRNNADKRPIWRCLSLSTLDSWPLYPYTDPGSALWSRRLIFPSILQG